jgi:RNA polymerase sigma-70 factor (ECF subfamily)
MVEDVQKRSGASVSAPREGGRSAAPSISELEEMFREMHPRIFAYIRSRVNSVAEAEDLTADILERALTHISSFDATKGAFSTWLFRIAHNMWVNHLKKKKRRGRYHAEFDSATYAVPDGDPSPEQDMVRKEQTARMLECLDTLSERQQEILTLRFAGQLTNREIARVLEMNERTVSVTILRALRRLRQMLAESDGT